MASGDGAARAAATARAPARRAARDRESAARSGTAPATARVLLRRRRLRRRRAATALGRRRRHGRPTNSGDAARAPPPARPSTARPPRGLRAPPRARGPRAWTAARATARGGRGLRDGDRAREARRPQHRREADGEAVSRSGRRIAPCASAHLSAARSSLMGRGHSRNARRIGMPLQAVLRIHAPHGEDPARRRQRDEPRHAVAPPGAPRLRGGDRGGRPAGRRPRPVRRAPTSSSWT